jgi:hypothetical protein
MAPIKFNREFIERRMAEHQRWQHAVEYALIEEIIDEVQALPKRKPKSGELFEIALPVEMENSRRLKSNVSQ